MTFEQDLRTLARVPDAALDRVWQWPDKGPADVRNAFFYLLWLEQDALAASPPPANDAGRILDIAHAAFGDLRALLLSAPDDLLDRPPAEGEWSVRQTMQHTIRVERSYRANCEYALARTEDQPLDAPAERRPVADPADTAGDALGIVRALSRRRVETDTALSAIDDAALARPSLYGPVDDDFEIDVRFRLHRFAVHLAEHSQQIEKTLRALGRPDSDARSYVRRLSVLRARHERRSAPEVLARLDGAIAQVAATL